MKTPLFLLRHLFFGFIFTCKLCLPACIILSCFCNGAYARAGAGNRHNSRITNSKKNPAAKADHPRAAAGIKGSDILSPPAISYSGPKIYQAGLNIAPLSPKSSDVATPAYNNPPLTIGNGFSAPTGVAVDAAGNVFVADFSNSAIKKIAAGSGTVTTLPSVANGPAGIAVDAAGNIYYSDNGTNSVKKIAISGGSTVTIGLGFNDPLGLAVDGAGNVYVSDGGNNVVKKITAGTGAIVTLGSGFSLPDGLALDAAGNLFVADDGNGAVKMIPADGGAVVTLATGFTGPSGIAVDAGGNVYVTDDVTNLVSIIPSGGGATTVIGSGFSGPEGMATDGVGNIYVADSKNNAVKVIKPTGGFYINALPVGLKFNNTTGVISGAPAKTSPATTYTVTAYNIAGSTSAALSITINLPPAPTLSYSSPQTYLAGLAIVPLSPTKSSVAVPGYSSSPVTLGSGFVAPEGVAVDLAGNVYVADNAHSAIKKITAGTGTITTLGGSAFNHPTGVAVDAAGNVYVADNGHNAVKEIQVNGGQVLTLGSGFSSPRGVAVDAAGDVFIADFGNNAVKEIAAGQSTPFNIVPGFGSPFNGPSGVAVDAAGNVYVADQGSGTVKTVPAGDNPHTLSAGFLTPASVAVDALGNVYVADLASNLVTKIITPDATGGGATSIVGSGFNGPAGVAVDRAGNVYIGDEVNNAVKKIVPVGGFYLSNTLPVGLNFNSTTGVISGTPANPNPATAYTITAYNSVGSAAAALNISINLPPLPSLSYASPQTYLAGMAIAPLSPAATNVAVPGYSSSTILGGGFFRGEGVALDAAGNLYVADRNNNAIKKIAAGNGAITIAGAGFNKPNGVALDAAGNIYVADFGSNTIKEIPVNGGAIATLGSGFNQPVAVAVDAALNVYIADLGNSAVEKIPAGQSTPVQILSGISPQGLAIDAAGNLYVTDTNSNTLIKIPADGGPKVTLVSGISNLQGVAVDVTGNVYFDVEDGNGITKVPADGSAQVVLGSGSNAPTGIAIDGAGNVYFAQDADTTVKKIKPAGGYYINALPAGLSFNAATGVISGAFLSPGPATTYTVTAYNSSGGTSAALNITVNQPPVPTITYSSPKTYLAGLPVTPLSPAASNVAVPGYSSSPISLGSGIVRPAGLAVDAAGNVYVADAGGNAVKKIAAGTGTVTTLGSGFSEPLGIAVDVAGNVYFADVGSNSVKEIPVNGGPVATLGSGFNNPQGVAVDAAFNVYVADFGNNAVKEIPAGGGAIVTVGSGFSSPIGIAVDAAGNIYVTDSGNGAVKMIAANGGAVVTIASGFTSPSGISVDALANVYITQDVAGVLEKIPAGGGPLITLASGLSLPYGTVVDGAGKLYVGNNVGNDVDEIRPSGGYYINAALPAGFKFNTATGVISGTPVTVSPAANYIITAYNPAGSASAALSLNVVLPPVPVISYSSPKTYLAGVAITPLLPAGSHVAAPGYSAPVTIGSGFLLQQGIAADAAGNVYVADVNHNAVKKIAAGNGPVTTIGSGFNHPAAVAVDAAGNVYVADAGNNAVKEVPFNGGPVLTLGSGFATPLGVAVDAAGNIYVADFGNKAVKEILQGQSTPITLAPGFNQPAGVAVDAVGNVYVTDEGDGVVKMVPADGGAVITLASGINTPRGIAVDAAGNVYFAGDGNIQVQMIPAGGGPAVFFGSLFRSPIGLAVDGTGNIYVSDQLNSAVNEMTPAGGYYVNALPAGLIFNNTTGAISGTPLIASVASNYTVTAYNAAGSSTAAVNIAVANLASLTLSSGTLSPLFTPATTSYTAAVGNTVSSVTITPTTSDRHAAIKVDGAVVASGTASAAIPLNVGSNIITIIVTADDLVTQTYTVTVTRAPSSVATLSSIGSSITPLSPVFNSGITNYTLSVNNGTASITVKPVTTDANATIKVNGITLVSGITSGAIALAEGAITAINIVVTAQDGTTNRNYEIAVTRGPSSIASLSNIQLSSGTLTPVFAAATTSYTANVPNSTSTLAVTPTSTDANATIKINGTTVASGTSSGGIALAEGAVTAISVVVAAQNGTITKTYSINVARAASTIATLSAIGSSITPLTPIFNSTITSYTLSVSNGIASMTLKPVTTDANATIKVNGTSLTPGTTSGAITLAEGTTTAINVVVTAQDGATTKTYTITVTRAPSIVATLSSIGSSVTPLTPVFNPATTSYTLSVSNATATMTVKPVTTDVNATIKVNGTSLTSGTTSGAIALDEGTTTDINVVVTAQDGTTTKTYTITITRAPSSDATLSVLGPQFGPLAPVFNAATTSYTLSVGNTTTSMTVKPVTADAHASIKVNGTATPSGTTFGPIALAPGSNTISTVVTAQNGTTTKTYTLTVTRASGGADSFDPGISVTKPKKAPTLADDGINVHQGISPNGDGVNDFLQIDNISQYPDNKLTIMNRNGQLIYEAKGYDNSSKAFDGHSNKNGQMQLPGTYFYQLDYTINGAAKHKTGFIVLKY